MAVKHSGSNGWFLPSCAFAFALLSCILGLSLCLIKSPQARSSEYLNISVNSLGSGSEVAVPAAMEAVRLNPSSTKAWIVLSHGLEQSGDHYNARKAQAIAARLNERDDPAPVYALPAELKISFLADVKEPL